MRRMLSGLAVLALGSLAGTSVQAQACQGLNSPSNLQLSGGITSGAKEFDAGVALGKSTGVFVGVSGNYFKFNDDHGGGHSIGGTGTLGYQVSAGSNKKLALCPVAQVGFSSGPNDDDVSESNILASGGLSIGIPVSSSGSKMSFIPTASLSFEWDHIKVTDKATDESASNSETEAVIAAGVGFVFSPTFALRPLVSIGTHSGSNAVFSITASIGFGKK
jgi:hypothetical protein